MTTIVIITFAGLMLAYANGANDNFKGVATLYGSGTTQYRSALVWATITTLAGSCTALILAQGLLQTFSGKGLVPPDIITNPTFPAAVGLAAGATVMMATRFGFPISTTHALIGSLVGAGLVAANGSINFQRLGDTFLIPLILSPALAIVLAFMIYPQLRSLRSNLGITHETCVCIGQEIVATLPGTQNSATAIRSIPNITIDTEANCRIRYNGHLFGIPVSSALDSMHFLSAGAVCFARGLNDTPKIAALLLAGGTINATWALVSVGVFMALGGILSARRVAFTMSNRISEMNPGQGLTANLITAALVIGASKLGVPVSTTHVSCSSLFGIGATTRQAHWGVIGQIALAWLVTLPVGALLGAGAMIALN